MQSALEDRNVCANNYFDSRPQFVKAWTRNVQKSRGWM